MSSRWSISATDRPAGVHSQPAIFPAQVPRLGRKSQHMVIRGHGFEWGARTYVMGIVNVTPDSFSGDGLGADPAAAAERAKRMEADGADWLDVGGESSRPGAEELDPAEEARRVIPAIEAVRDATDLPISVDTYHASVARRALAAGADAVNDIWGLRRDPEMARVVAETGAVIIAMHNQRGRTLADPYAIVPAIQAGWSETLRICGDHGIGDDRIILDPGFGFGWTPAQNLQMLRELAALAARGYPLLLATSRKSTIGHVLGDRPVEGRLIGTAATLALGAVGGADMVRVHDVSEAMDVLRVTDAVVSSGPKRPFLHPVVIALGSNLGDRMANLRAAVTALEAAGVFVMRPEDRSSVWETAPVPADQPAFLNAVVAAETSHSPEALFKELKDIEHALGRRPERRWGPRPIDLDILFYGNEAVRTPELTIPHERILERSFVLAPLSEVFPWRMPHLGVSPLEALEKVGTEGLRRVGEL